jgi:uncharacterized protein YqjF (DUF2071 family)
VNNDFDYSVLDQRDHRPWPMPGTPWVMTQTWHDLLFAHWPIEPSLMAARVPNVLDLDLFEGTAWLGIVPFRMTNVAPRGVPPLSWMSAFPELNVRTYVRVGDKPGVFFFSLDATNRMAVTTARVLFGLPYHRAAMEMKHDGDTVEYRSRRGGDAAADALFDGTYEPCGAAFQPAPGTLDYFLTERYCLYTVNRSARPTRVDIHHAPWSLQRATATLRTNTMAAASGIQLPATAPILHFSRRQDAVAWLPTAARA